MNILPMWLRRIIKVPMKCEVCRRRPKVYFIHPTGQFMDGKPVMVAKCPYCNGIMYAFQKDGDRVGKIL